MSKGEPMGTKKMELVKLGAQTQATHVDLSKIPADITEWELEQYFKVVSVDLDVEQRSRVAVPENTYPRQDRVFAVHWHPEFVPMDLIRTRIKVMYPNVDNELIIPTQHNEILTWDGYSGVEVDCFSHGFNRKVQLLLHFRKENVEGADTLRSMCAHTLKYRSSQLFNLMEALTEDSLEERRMQAAAETNADEDLVEFCRIYTRKLKTMLDENWDKTPVDMRKNKLVRNYFDTLRGRYGDRFINRVQVYLKAVKTIVKAHFPLKYFYRASEIIEEARSHGAGIVIPHPEQFWPILLADYDVDGVEVWNPQSREYTEFLISVLDRLNSARRGSRKLLVFMGDDCHMGEKVKDPAQQDKAKAAREIGLQPWEDMAIRKELILAGISRAQVMEEYRERLG